MRTKIALDAMGGDFAPKNLIDGALQALLEEPRLEVVLVGDEEALKESLLHRSYDSDRLEVVHAEEVIGMDDSAADAVRKKPNSSVMVAAGQVREGRADGLVTAGNTAAAVAASLLNIGRLPGIHRPAIASIFPTMRDKACVVLDVGATSEVQPRNLLQFAIMGEMYARFILEIDEPTVGLLSVGEEEKKGSEVVVETNRLMKENLLKFYGNVQGGDILKGTTDVVVCDGFVGNVALKFAEAIGEMVFATLKREIRKGFRTRVGAWLMKPAFRRFRRAWDYSEYGGAPLLGIKNVVIICHGKSNPKAIKNAVLVAGKFVSEEVNRHISGQVAGEDTGI